MRPERPAYVVRTAPQQVAAAIRQEILEGRLKPGDSLPSELELAAQFGVSRPTVRAGLQELCAAQVLSVQRGRSGGYRVGDLSLETLEVSIRDQLSLFLVVETLRTEHFFEVRAAHELLCAETAALRRTTPSLMRLDALVREMDDWRRDSAGVDSAEAVSRRAFELDLEFHRALAEATGNPLIQSFEGALIAVLHRLLGGGSSVMPDRALGNVDEVVTAVRLQDAPGAREAMRRHLRHSAMHYGLRSSILGD